MTLAEFLLARISEDKADAKAASQGGLFHFSMWEVGRSRHHVGMATVKDVGRPAENASDVTPEYAAHSARWDPRRVLAECEAKRRIVEACVDCTDRPDDDPTCDGLAWHTLTLLALPFADHPDYDERWRP